MKNTKAFYGSSYDRGLEHLLRMWPEIKEAVPEATLDICYGWNTFDAAFGNNPERQAYKEKMNKMMEAEGITHHGRLGRQELKRVRESCGIWTYPTHFPEINCITALETQLDGLVPVVINYAALKETVGCGIRIDGDIWMPDVQEKYKNELISLMKDAKRWQDESQKAREFAKSYSWDMIAKEWEHVFEGE